MHKFLSVRQLSLFFPLFALLAFFTACEKDPVDNPTIHGNLTPFKVTVVNRLQTSASITWEPATNLYNSDSIFYKIFINSRQLVSGLGVTAYNITGISPDTLYKGIVLAYNASGDTATATFELEKVNGIMWYGSEYFGGTDMLEARGMHTGLRLYQTAFGTPGAGSNVPYFSTPVFFNDTVYIANTQTTSFSLQAFNAKTGANIWKKLPYPAGYSNGIISELTYYNGKIFGMARNGAVAINAATGDNLWTNTSITDGSRYVSNPVMDDNKLLVAAGSKLYALDPNTGSMLWYFTYAGAFSARPVIYKNLILFSTDAQRTYAIDKNTGAMVWARNFIGSNAYSNTLPPPVIQDNICITASTENGVFGLNPLTGETIWNYSNGLDQPSSFALNKTDGIVYFSQGNGIPLSYSTITALKCTTGDILWEKNNGSVSTANLIYVKGMLYMRHYTERIESVNVASNTTYNNHTYNTTNRCANFCLSEDGITYYNSSHGNY